MALTGFRKGEMEKVLFLTINFPPMGGGMARHSYDVAIALKEAGKVPLVLTSVGMDGDKDIDSKAGLSVVRLRGIREERLFNHYLRSIIVFFGYAFYYSITHKVRAIFVNTWSIAGVAAFLIKKILGVPYFVFAHGLDVYAPQKDKRASRLMSIVLKNASLVIANSRFTKGLIEGAVSGVKVMVLNPVIDLDRFNRRFHGEKKFEGKKVLLTVGRLVERKGHDMVIRALRKVTGVFPEIVYCIAGEGPTEESLKSLVRRLGLEGNVIFAGKVDDDSLSSYYHSCDIFIMASKEIKESGEVEGFGIVFLEAGACGKPVIGGISGGIPDAVLDGVNGILVDPLDPDDIARSIIKLLTDHDLARKLGEGGRLRVERELNTRVFGERLKEVVNNLD